MEKFKNVSLIALPYFIICGGLYHMAFWSTFDINGLAYIGISDIIKSFIYPFLSSTAIIVLFVSFQEQVSYQIMPIGGGRDTWIGKILNSKFVIRILLIVWVFILVILYIYGKNDNWISFGLIASVVPFIVLQRYGVLRKLITDYNIRNQIIALLIYVPIFSFVAGKYNSNKIYGNVKYKYALIQNIMPKNSSLKTDTLKLIDVAGNQYFFTDTRNSFTLMLKVDKTDTLVLREYTKEFKKEHWYNFK